MLFSSLQFIFGFVPLALIGFHVSARVGTRMATAWLVLASLAFYACWKLSFLPILLISIGFNFVVSRLIVMASRRPALQSFLLVIGIGCDLLALVYYKYLSALCGFLGAEGIADVSFGEIVLPLGISFFTFTQIGYLVDVKQGVSKSHDLLTYALFVTFFPHLIAGPILHNREMIPQFLDLKTYRFSGQSLIVGLTIFFIGLAKKTLLADPLSADVAAGFGGAGTVGFSEAWAAVIGYSLQLYFDFSGYCDMAIGLARMFNIRFPVNFNSPYKSTTVIEYWQRFHMTLTRFITMYIYSPLALWITRRRMARGGSAGGRGKPSLAVFASTVLVPTIITMALAGIWHGAGSQFLIFGLLHGTYIVVNHFTRTFFPASKRAAERGRVSRAAIHAAKVLAVYLAALVALCFFRASSSGAALHMLAGMIGLHGAGTRMPSASMVALIAIQLAIVWVAPNTQQIMQRYEPSLGRAPAGSKIVWRPSAGWAYAFGILAGLGIVAVGGASEFLYFQF